MRVGFDCSPLVRPHPLGIVRVVHETVGAIEARGGLEVVRLAPTPGQELSSWRQRLLPKLAGERGLAGIHSFLSAFPLRGPGRRVQTIHELPWRHGVGENAGPRHRLWAAIGPLRADRVVCATEVVAGDLRRRLLPGAARVRVCPWGVGPPFGPAPPPGVVDEAVLHRYRLPEDPLVVCPGAVRPKKNLAAVLHGVAHLHDSGGPRVHVVVTGEETAQLRGDLGLVSRLGLNRHVSTPGVLSDEELAGLLRTSAAATVLSTSEGFGLPALEALSCGVGVLVPRASAQAEVAGAAGIEVEPADPESVAAGLRLAVEQRERDRELRIERARAFTWERSARAIEAVWEELA
ncbi:MAG: glycosyltransferase [Planctomycetota bacterium]|jgi:glycosyltransferase involved in cell wall biosynthesis|nr:glycosyltransferase [Planctomycetota bacterium]MDP6763597.1 glycosyltransferase [Planctomycetota bacterium]MDP6988454.1 glycosyltransferase [Planctomycetota bacterium]